MYKYIKMMKIVYIYIYMNISGIDMVSKSCAKHFSNTQETEASKIVLLQTIGQPIPGILLGGWQFDLVPQELWLSGDSI